MGPSHPIVVRVRVEALTDFGEDLDSTDFCNIRDLRNYKIPDSFGNLFGLAVFESTDKDIRDEGLH